MEPVQKHWRLSHLVMNGIPDQTFKPVSGWLYPSDRAVVAAINHIMPPGSSVFEE